MMKRYSKKYVKLLFFLSSIVIVLLTLKFLSNKSKNNEKQLQVTNLKDDVHNALVYRGNINDSNQGIWARSGEAIEDTKNGGFFSHGKIQDNQDIETLSNENEEDSGPIYIDIKDTLLSTPENILKVSRPRFLKDVKNPCFAVDERGRNVGNIALKDALEKPYHMKCLPYAMVAGFNGCGTNELMELLQVHRKISSGNNLQQQQRLSTGDNTFSRYHHPHFWDNMENRENFTLDKYSKFYSDESQQIIQSFINQNSKIRTNDRLHHSENVHDNHDMIILDGTPHTLSFGDHWQSDEDNNHLQTDYPRSLLPHKIYHILPKMKIIVMLCSPTNRLIHDYVTNFKGRHFDKDFRKKIYVAIDWWKHCLEDLRLPLRNCAYGKTPHIELPAMDFEQCYMESKDTMFSTNSKLCHDEVSWTNNTADRLRTGLYNIFIQDWLKIFPKEQFLFIKYEDFVKNPMKELQSKVLPFLDLPEFTDNENLQLGPILAKIKQNKLQDLHFEVSELTRLLLDDFYQVPLKTLYDLLEDKTFYWKPIFEPIIKKKKKPTK